MLLVVPQQSNPRQEVQSALAILAVQEVLQVLAPLKLHRSALAVQSARERLGRLVGLVNRSLLVTLLGLAVRLPQEVRESLNRRQSVPEALANLDCREAQLGRPVPDCRLRLVNLVDQLRRPARLSP